MRAIIPNLLTLANAFSGSMAIICLFGEQSRWIWIWFGLALLFDLLDGAVARILQVNSSLGKELDSLADAISFALLPGLMLYQWLYAPPFAPLLPQTLSTGIIASAGLIFTLSAIFRLAVFNLDEGQEDSFSGLPTPAAAIAVIALSVFLESGDVPEWLYGRFALYGLIFLLSYLMISSLRVINLKFQSPDLKDNWHRYLLLAVVIAGASFSWRWALILLIPWLLIWSIGYHTFISGPSDR